MFKEGFPTYLFIYFLLEVQWWGFLNSMDDRVWIDEYHHTCMKKLLKEQKLTQKIWECMHCICLYSSYRCSPNAYFLQNIFLNLSFLCSLFSLLFQPCASMSLKTKMQFEETVLTLSKKIQYEVFELPSQNKKNTTFFNYCQHTVYKAL